MNVNPMVFPICIVAILLVLAVNNIQIENYQTAVYYVIGIVITGSVTLGFVIHQTIKKECTTNNE